MLENWLPPPDVLRLQSNEVHVWRSSLDLADVDTGYFFGTLSPEERSRSDKYRFRRDRQHFIAARGRLRSILARYLEAGPEQIEFCYSRHGKPRLAGGFGNRGLSFNLSHARGLALFAFALDRKIGVDLEYSHPDCKWHDIAARFFTAAEQAELESAAPTNRQRLFFSFWTRKEAFLKAKGTGLTGGLEMIDVTMRPEGQVCILHPRHGSEAINDWSVVDLDPGGGYLAALAVEGADWRLSCWQNMMDS